MLSMKSFKITAFLCGVLALSACATTPKQPLTFDQLGKFSTFPLNAHSYRVGFKAPARMSQGTAEEITLLKSAQTTIKQGFHYFKVMNPPTGEQATRQTVVYSTPYYYHNPAYAHYPHSSIFWEDPFFNPPQQVVYYDPIEINYMIEMYKENQQPKDAFDARLILQTLGQKYGLTATGDIAQP